MKNLEPSPSLDHHHAPHCELCPRKCRQQPVFMFFSSCSVLPNPAGDCHLTEWSEWSTCELTCIDGRSFETIGRQSRSRTFIIQSFENQDSCPQQVLETRPCAGTKNTFWFLALIDQCLFYFYVKYNRTAVTIFTCRRQMLSLHMEGKSLEQQWTNCMVPTFRWH